MEYNLYEQINKFNLPYSCVTDKLIFLKTHTECTSTDITHVRERARMSYFMVYYNLLFS